MKYKVTATLVFEVEADEPEWAQELVDVNCLSMHIHNLEGKEIYPLYEVEAVEQSVQSDALKVRDMGEVNGVKLTYVNGNVFATPSKRR